MFEFDLPRDNNEGLENTQILVKILTFLSSEELRKARLVNFAFNKIITAHPDLLWAKNKLRVCIRSSNENEKHLQKEWTQLRLHKLVADYNCPNFHFVKTDLLAHWAVGFFQSSIRHQIKHLVLTKCQVTGEILIHILACIGRRLEHLEVEDFSKFASSAEESILESRSIPYLYFPCLTTLILSGESYGSNSCTGFFDKSLMLDLPRNFMHIVLNGSRQLQKISFLGWDARTCQRFTKLLGSIDPGKLEHVQSLEISCAFDKYLNAKQQFGLLKPLGCVYIPYLRKLSLRFEDKCTNVEGFSYENLQLVETMTNNIATLIEGCASTLESIELLNCPVANNVFRAGINSFPRLRHVNTSGSFVTRLDDDANPLYPSPLINRISQHRQTNEMHEINETTMEIVGSNPGNRYLYDSETWAQKDVYKIMCAVILIVAGIHASTKWAFGPYIGGQCEVFIYAMIVLVAFKGHEISEMWTTLHSE